MVQSTGRGRGTSKKRWDNHHVDSAKSGAATGHGSAMPPPWKSVVRNPGCANPGLFTTQDFGVWALLGTRGCPWGSGGEYGGVTYVSVSGCPFRWITPLFYPCLQMPGYPLPLWGDASRHSGGMGGRHQIRRGVGRRPPKAVKPRALFLASRISGSCPGPWGRGRHPGPLDLGILPGDVAGSPGDLEEDPACGPGRGIVERVTLELDLAPQED